MPANCHTLLRPWIAGLAFFLITIGGNISPSAAQTPEKPKISELPSNVFNDFKIYAKDTFRGENIPAIAGVTAATVLLIYYDQKLINNAQKFGKSLGLSNKDNTKTYLKANSLSLFRGPADTGSALYFLGDGWLHISICGSFYAYGLTKNNDRAFRTGHALMEGLATTGIATQALKHITGRESPSVATESRGVWRFFPNQSKYIKKVSRYDAFPSGHLATAVMTVTVISESYPEYRFVKPVGYGLLTLLSFQMMNNGVHWVSDYPLAVALGYSFGKIAVKRANGAYRDKKTEQSGMEYRLMPAYTGSGPGLFFLARL